MIFARCSSEYSGSDLHHLWQAQLITTTGLAGWYDRKPSKNARGAQHRAIWNAARRVYHFTAGTLNKDIRVFFSDAGLGSKIYRLLLALPGDDARVLAPMIGRYYRESRFGAAAKSRSS